MWQNTFTLSVCVCVKTTQFKVMDSMLTTELNQKMVFGFLIFTDSLSVFPKKGIDLTGKGET